MKKTATALLLFLLAFAVLAQADTYYTEWDTAENLAPVLNSLTHNCTNTGVMVPAAFSPETTSYLLTVGSTVSRVSLTPYCSDPYATITVNGVRVTSGTASSYIQMDDNPKLVTIRVTNYQGISRDYTVFLQRRPSTQRTRTSYGYVNEVYYRSGSWYINADLVTVSWDRNGYSSATNKTRENYRYPLADHCALYVGTMHNPVRVADGGSFSGAYQSGRLYRFVYIADKIEAVIPFETDY